ncbi:GFA family protein [Agaribacter marinus]|uniref:S-(Hydroxymethyl)glutathione synthase n=1 Tax=Agaribacter marinus TaxID=1431249 RepID=A0AA37SXN9_9ALTE|nr:GFA family protein [Agaribacter marinus]GLR69596.1 S-(hydroxymethyl)glutathione synthase [Agaribacter marinus]
MDGTKMENRIFAEGSCNCASVTFSVSVALENIFICHCSICRKSTGSGGIAVTVVPTESLTMKSGHDFVQKWVKPNHDWLTNFCKRCGSPLPGKNDEKHSYIPVSLLDSGYENLEVKHHLFADSKANWEEIGDIGKKHVEGFGG